MRGTSWRSSRLLVCLMSFTAIVGSPTRSAAQAPSAAPNFQSYGRFDFVPGETVIALDDFGQDAIGDFPARWNTNASGEVYRRVEALEVQVIDGHPTATRMKVTDLERGAHTLTETRNIRYDNGVPDDVFTERSLRNPPRKWLER